MKKKPYRKARMTNWFQPSILLNTALKAVISGTFGNYADRRELQAALSSKGKESDPERLRLRFAEGKKDIWIDLICDTGDGFDSTFSVAHTAAQKELDLGKEKTFRGDLLILGGDEVYPFPTIDTYNTKFKLPFDAAADKSEAFLKEARPCMFAIPGNHDWYDGLGNFMKVFCQERMIGIWQTVQKRSYFAVPLPNNYWIWATDIQLNSDIDQPQLDYFTDVATEQMKDGDYVILVTAEPAWVYNQVNKNDKSFDRLEYFIARNVHDSEKVINKKFKLALTLTGDLHHYSRYCSNPNGHQYITAGGGGAFLQLTHNLPLALDSVNQLVEEKRIVQQKIFPSRKDSLKLLLGNVSFPIRNRAFTGLSCLVFSYLFWLFQSFRLSNSGGLFLKDFRGIGLGSYMSRVTYYFLGMPSLAISIAVLFAGFWLFADRKVNRKGTFWVGLLHAVLQTFLFFIVMYWLAQTALSDHWGSFSGNMIIVVALSITGGTVASLLMGIYLYLSNRLLGMHEDEASSSLANPDYKNFLRLHVHAKGVTVYPVGIKKVRRNWTITGDEDGISVNGNPVKAELIEEPIQVLNSEL